MVAIQGSDPLPLIGKMASVVPDNRRLRKQWVCQLGAMKQNVRNLGITVQCEVDEDAY